MWTAIIGGGVGLLCLWGLVALMRSGAEAEREMKAAEANARPAEATVLSWHRHDDGNMETRQMRGDLRTIYLRVHAPEGDYTTSAKWQLAYQSGERLQEGARLAIKIHSKRKDIVFPAEDWLEFRLGDYAEQRYAPANQAPTL